MIIDTHAHLFYEDIVKDIDSVLERAAESGISRIIIPAVDYKTSIRTLKLCDKYEMLYGAVGFHPCDIKETNPDDIKLLEELTSHHKIVAIGEIGLDYYWDKTYIDKQVFFFKEQMELAKDKNLPVIIHTRNSTSDAVEIIKQSYNEKLKGQFHCFSGNETDLNEILKLYGFYLSYCGNATYKKFGDLNSLLNTPVERMLSETDTPYLTPEPHRGRKNEPSYLKYTLKKIAELKNIDNNVLEETVYNNCMKLFFTI
ncbi:MAG: TatD family hydrolase [Ignavibacteriae bacterium]|nr:TatD family hydrolase [Ignavibacteriota bacterium]